MQNHITQAQNSAGPISQGLRGKMPLGHSLSLWALEGSGSQIPVLYELAWWGQNQVLPGYSTNLLTEWFQAGKSQAVCL